MKKSIVFAPFVLFLCITLSIASVYAVGGGGGGSSGSSGGGGSGGTSFSDVKCYEDGSISFQMYKKQDILAVRKSDGKKIAVAGSWNREDFNSNETLFTEAGQYSITNDLGTTKSFSCPGLKFACSLISIQNIECIKNSSGLYGIIDIVNESDAGNLKFNYKTKEKLLSYDNGSRSPELNNLRISRNGNSFFIQAGAVDASEFEVIHTKCLGKRYIYARVNCSENAEQSFRTAAVNASSQKCGGLLDIKDRVRCRVNLETGFNDYNNFYPEECKDRGSKEEAEKCYWLYKNVSECWELETSTERIACLKGKIRLRDIKDEKDSCTDNVCRNELNEKILTMIKLRFYNLEEQAEILSEHGLLDKEDLIDFATDVELKKKEFNAAGSRDEKAKIIIDVRNLWNVLMKKVKKT